MFASNRPDAFTGTEESLERTSSAKGSAMQAQTKSQETCMSVRSRSLMVREGEAAARVPPLSCGTGGGGGAARFGSSVPAWTALRLRVLTLRPDTLIACPLPPPAAGAGASSPPCRGNSEGGRTVRSDDVPGQGEHLVIHDVDERTGQQSHPTPLRRATPHVFLAGVRSILSSAVRRLAHTIFAQQM